MRGKLAVTIVSLGLLLSAITPALADDPDTLLGFDPSHNNPDFTTSERVTFLSGGQDPLSITFNFINLSLSFLGIISLGLILYAGILWFRSGDNEEVATQAKKLIQGAVVGLVLTLGAYSISLVVFTQVNDATEAPITSDDYTDL